MLQLCTSASAAWQESPWLNLDEKIQPALMQNQSALASTPDSARLPASPDFRAFKFSDLGTDNHRIADLSTESLKTEIRDRGRKSREERGKQQVVAFLNINPDLRREISQRSIEGAMLADALPAALGNCIRAAGLSVESFAKILNLPSTGRYSTSEHNFHSFCITEHIASEKPLKSAGKFPENARLTRVETNCIYVIFNEHITLIVSEGDSPSVNRMQKEIMHGKLTSLGKRDRLPFVTSLLRDVIDYNSSACQRALDTFSNLKTQNFNSYDPSILSSFKMALTEFQNYWISEEDPVSGMERMLRGIKRDISGFRTSLNQPAIYSELLEKVHLTTQKVHQLNRSLTLRQEARRSGVESRSLHISATLAALGSAFLPNATVTQIPLPDWKLQLIAHGVATLLSFSLLLRMKKLGWFDFVTENFGDLFGLGKLKKWLFRKDKQETREKSG